MQFPIQIRKLYYMRVLIPRSDGRNKYRWLSLGTDNLTTAQLRFNEVLNQADIKNRDMLKLSEYG
jgi:hypothetical protein